jgi:hopene-associated glycosyltransferase HpnB
VLVLIVAAASVLAAAAWAYLLAGHGGYWRTDQRLPPGRPGLEPASWPEVVAVVPARDEAAVLPMTLPALLRQDYPGRLAVILVDDESRDGTAQVAAGLAQGAGRPLRVIRGGELPAGWAGKVWAMEQGLRAAGGAQYVLFTDADIACAPGTVTALVRAAEAGELALVSQMALLRADAFWERLLVPAFVYFFAQLYPFRRVNRAGSRTAAAAGGCMLVRTSVLRAAGSLAAIRAARIDDVALGRLLKRGQRGRCWLGVTTDITSERQYTRLSEVWDMVARSAYTQLRYSPFAVAGTIVGLAWLYLLPPAAAVAGLAGTAAWAAPRPTWLAAGLAGLAGWALMTITYLPILRLYRLSPLRAPGLPLVAAMYAAMTADSARRHHAGRGGEWKGRTI